MPRPARRSRSWGRSPRRRPSSPSPPSSSPPPPGAATPRRRSSGAASSPARATSGPARARGRSSPWRSSLGLAATAALAALAAWGAFGTVVPATLLAKRQMAALAAPDRLAAAALFWRRAAQVAAFYLGPLALPAAALGAAGQAALLT